MNFQVSSQSFRQLLTHSIIAGICFGVFSGCSFIALKKNVKIYKQRVRLSGHVWNPSPQKKPVIVLLYQVLNNKKRVVSYRIYHKTDRFQFMELPGQYYVAAFEDANRDLIYQDSEWATYFGPESGITVDPGQDQLTLDLTLQPPGVSLLPGSPNLSSPATQARLRLPKIRIGEIVELEDGRFTDEKGRLGLWEPIRFLEEVGGGLYFLEHFDPRKIPVIFIHGAGGTPHLWRQIILRMDRDAFQPWLFHYPSGLYLDDVTELLRQAMSQISLTYQVNKLIMVAHSMGGMVAREEINLAIQKGRGQQFPLLLVTISTPWGGHQGARMAMDHSTLGIIPSWIDMAPNSPFQKKLFETQLPPTIQHYLFFSYRGGLNPFAEGNDDGAVSLASQLYNRAQYSAKKTLGFNEDHTSILKSPEMISKLNEIFKTFFKKTKPEHNNEIDFLSLVPFQYFLRSSNAINLQNLVLECFLASRS